jgi:serine protease Do
MGEAMQEVLPAITYIRAQQFQKVKEVNPVTKQVVEKTVEVTPVIGTGFIIRDNIVVTNHHVIARAIANSSDIYVSFIESNERHKASLIGYDKITDVALLRLVGEFPSVKINTGSSIHMGQEVFTISHFYGIGWSATNGIISSIERNDPRYPYVRNLQLQILSGSGSSGGAVFNTKGEVVALNRAIISMNATATGANRSQLSMVAFPVRADALKESINRILAEHVVERVDLGVQLIEFGADSAYHVNQDPDFFTGVMVFAVSADSSTPLKTSDIIISVDKNTFTDPGELLRYLDEKYDAGDVVKFYVYRDSDVINIDVTLESVGG